MGFHTQLQRRFAPGPLSDFGPDRDCRLTVQAPSTRVSRPFGSLSVKRRQVLSALGGMPAGLALAGCAEMGPGGDREGGQAPNDAQNETGDAQTGNGTDIRRIAGEVGDNVPEDLEIVRHDLFESNDFVGVTGAIENTGDSMFQAVEVEVTLRDGDTLIGEFVDTSRQETDSLVPDEIWQFVVLFPDENLNRATEYTIEVDGVRVD